MDDESSIIKAMLYLVTNSLQVGFAFLALQLSFSIYYNLAINVFDQVMFDLMVISNMRKCSR